MIKKKLFSLELRKQLMILIILIFIPVLIVLLFTGFKQYQQSLKEIEYDVQDMILLFKDEQLNITKLTHQFLKVISQVPSVRNLELNECNKLLQAIHKDNPQFSTIVAADNKGIIECCAIPLKKPIIVTDRSWFKRINETNQFVIDKFIISRSAKKASLPFAYPVTSSDGKLKVVVGAAFDLEYYKSFFDKIPITRNSDIIVTDRTGKILYGKNKKNICIGKTLKECQGISIPNNKKGKFEHKNNEGIEHIYWYEKFSVGQKSNEICILVGISKQIISKESKLILINNLLVLIIIILGSLILAWSFGNKLILSPITMLLEKTMRVKKGDYSLATKEFNYPGELRTLSKAFDEMIEKLLTKENERDHVEEKLRERENRLKILFEQAADSIYVSNVEGQFI